MSKRIIIAIVSVVCMCCGMGCSQEKSSTDRTAASDMFARICRLTEEYTRKLSVASDSADWAEMCTEYESKLDKICLGYPPDTDLLLTEGQNDTIQSLIEAYVKARSERIKGLMYPVVEADSLSIDSLSAVEEVSSGVSD